MIELREWLASNPFPDKPWLVLGKGPTFARRDEFDLTAYNTLSLNHAVRELPVDVAHIIDLDVAHQCADVLLSHAGVVLMPRHPHIQSRASLLDLRSLMASVPVLEELARLGRLVCYDAATSREVGAGPVIDVRHFSSEAALDVLGHLGAKTVRSLGVDGGTSYAPAFSHLAGTTLLANGRETFSHQSTRLDEIAARHGLDYAPLVDPLRIYVGVDESQRLAAAVLAHSIERHATVPVRVVPMFDLDTPMPRSKSNRPRTEFSFSRFHIPELAGYRGRAVYLDADMLVFGDVRELAELEFGDATVMCTYQAETPESWRGGGHFHPGLQMSVMLLDCERLDWRIGDVVSGLDAGRYTYEQLMFELCIEPAERVTGDVPPAWNHLEEYHEGQTRLLHYTVVPTQPWKHADNPLGHLWLAALRDAVRDGAVPLELVRRQVKQGHVRPEVLRVAQEVVDQRRSEAPAASELAGLTPIEAELAATRAALDASYRWPVVRRRVLEALRERLPGSAKPRA